MKPPVRIAKRNFVFSFNTKNDRLSIYKEVHKKSRLHAKRRCLSYSIREIVHTNIINQRSKAVTGIGWFRVEYFELVKQGEFLVQSTDYPDLEYVELRKPW